MNEIWLAWITSHPEVRGIISLVIITPNPVGDNFELNPHYGETASTPVMEALPNVKNNGAVLSSLLDFPKGDFCGEPTRRHPQTFK